MFRVEPSFVATVPKVVKDRCRLQSSTLCCKRFRHSLEDAKQENSVPFRLCDSVVGIS